MKIRIFDPAISMAGRNAFAAFMRGCKAAGDHDVAWTKDIEEKCDIAVHASGVKGGRLQSGKLSQARARLIKRFGKNRVVIESPAIRTGLVGGAVYWRLGLGGFLRDEAEYANQNSPPDRWDIIAEEQQIVPMSFHVPLGRGHVLIMLQKTSDASLRGKCMIEWGNEMIREVRKHVDWPILIRPHPLETVRPPDFRGATLTHGHDDDWDHARAVVTYTSLSAIDSMIRGLPTWTMHEGNLAWEVTNSELAALKNPWFPEREVFDQFLYDLAYSQWKVSEIETGEPWLRLKAKL